MLQQLYNSYYGTLMFHQAHIQGCEDTTSEALELH